MILDRVIFLPITLKTLILNNLLELGVELKQCKSKAITPSIFLSTYALSRTSLSALLSQASPSQDCIFEE